MALTKTYKIFDFRRFHRKGLYNYLPLGLIIGFFLDNQPQIERIVLNRMRALILHRKMVEQNVLIVRQSFRQKQMVKGFLKYCQIHLSLSVKILYDSLVFLHVAFLIFS